MSDRFDGKTAIVTCGGFGIGEMVVIRLADEGARGGPMDVAPDALGRVPPVGVVASVVHQTDEDEAAAAASEAAEVVADVLPVREWTTRPATG